MIEKKTDKMSTKSAAALKTKFHSAIRDVFVIALECIEVRFGKNFDGYDALRKKILDVGNNSIREINKVIDDDYNVEKLPDVTKVYFRTGEES